MRHRVSKKKMNRDTDHRQSLLKNLSASLILHGKIKTTLAKAKFVKPYVEKLVTKAKKGLHITNLNRVNAKLGSKVALRTLFDDVATGFADRAGGYTRITKLGFRKGDRAEMAQLEWSTMQAKQAKPKTKAKAAAKETKDDENN